MFIRQRRAVSMVSAVCRLVLVVGVTVFLMPPRLSSAVNVIVVNTAIDEDVNNATCSLREAIKAANMNAAYNGCAAGLAGPAVDEIDFAILPAGGVNVITLSSDLPTITDPLMIAGYTQSGASRNTVSDPNLGTNTVIQIELDGAALYECLHFLHGSDGSIVEGLSIVNCGNIYNSTTTSNGILVDGFNDIIGDDTALSNVTIRGNFIGVKPDGSGIGNAGSGVAVLGATGTTIGGSNPGDRNIIAVNRVDGISLSDITEGTTTVYGNRIAANLAGQDTLRYQGIGIRVTNCPCTGGGGTVVIGGPGPGQGNLISGNLVSGIAVETTTNAVVTIQGNRIGVNAGGTSALSDRSGGIEIRDSARVTIGGSNSGEGNVISGNRSFAIFAVNSSQITIKGNMIGTNAAGSARIANSTAPSARAAINMVKSNQVTVGGPAAGDRNLVSGNHGDGVGVLANSSAIAVQGNFVGTNAAGSAALANDANGVNVSSSTDVTVLGNVISGNQGNGINASGGSSLKIQGNVVGLNATGAAPLPNARGISLHATSSALIGGTSASLANLISANGEDGIRLFGTIATLIQGNKIGTNAAGTGVFGNVGDGIRLLPDSPTPGATTNTRIGGTTAPELNLIVNNGGNGVTVLDPTSLDNAIRGNVFTGNGHLGIDLGNDGPTANDATDADTGPNDLQNFPLVTSATNNGSATSVSGTLTSTPNGMFAVDVYASPSCPASGRGDGASYLGSFGVTTDGTGSGTFTQTLPLAPVGWVVAATATRNNGTGGTSELSTCSAPITVPPVTPTPPNIALSVTRAGPNRLSVVITARAGQTLQRLDWTLPANAQAQAADGTALPNGMVLPAGSTSASFTLIRTSGQTVTLPIVVTGSFGTWNTFVGGGPNAW